MKFNPAVLKVSFCVLIICFGFGMSQAQSSSQSSIDSLILIEASTNEPERKIDLQIFIAGQSLGQDLATSKNYAEKAVLLCQNEKLEHKYTSAFHTLANALLNLGEYDEAIKTYEKSIEFVHVSNSNIKKADGYNGLGMAYMSLSKYTEATKYFYDALNNLNSEPNVELEGGIYANLGSIYYFTQNLNEAEKIYLKSIEIAEKYGNKYHLATSLSNLGLVYSERGLYDKSIDFTLRAAIINIEINNDNFLAVNYQNLSNSYSQINDIDNGFKYSNLALELSRKVKSKYNEGLALTGLGSLNLKINNFNEAEQHLIKSSSLATETNDLYQQKNIQLLFYELYKKKNDSAKALAAYEEHIILKDSIYTLEDAEKIAEEKIQFEYDKKAALDQLAFDQKIEKEKTFQKYLVLGLILLLGLLFFAFRAFQIKKNANKTISEKNIQLNKYSKIYENLIFSLSHDIKEPMLALQLLLKRIKADDEYLQRAAENIGDQVNSINSIVNNLLQLKKAAVEDENENTSKEEIIETVEKVTKTLQYMLSEKNINLINKLESSLSNALPISSKKLYLATLNLLSNAAKYSFPEGIIEIYAQEDGIYIRDYGSGIDSDILSKIGNENIDKSDETSGSGLGILLISNILSSSKMKLHFEQAINGGTLAGIILKK